MHAASGLQYSTTLLKLAPGYAIAAAHSPRVHRQQQLPHWQAAPTHWQPRADIGPVIRDPVPLPRPQLVPAAAAPSPLRERSSHRTRCGNDAAASIIGIVRIGNSIWIQRNTLIARKHVERGLSPGQWRRSAAKKCTARPPLPEEPNVSRNTTGSAAPTSTAAVAPSPLPPIRYGAPKKNLVVSGAELQRSKVSFEPKGQSTKQKSQAAIDINTTVN